MIHAPLLHAARYAHLHPRFAAAFAWLAVPANLALPDGRYEIDGDRLYAMAQSGTTRDPGVARFESHHRYIDIQVVVAGGENMEWTAVEGLTEQVAYHEAKDIRFHHEPQRPVSRVTVRPGEFTVFFPEDAHKPCCHLAANPSEFRKIVVKIAVA
jgi:biofilm protein TabA